MLIRSGLVPLRRDRLQPAHRVLLPSLIVTGMLTACASTAPGPSASPYRPDDPPRSLKEEVRASEGQVAWPENVATAVLMGSALLEAGDVRGALPYYRFAWEQDPADLELGQRYVEVAMQAGRPQEALSALDRMQQEHPEDVDVALQGARLLLLLGQMDRLERESAELLADHPETDPVVELRADVLRATGRIEEALALVDTLLRRRPDDATLLGQRGRDLLQLGRTEEAERDLRRCIELDPTSEDAVDDLAQLLAGQGRLEELAGLLERLVDEDPRSMERRARLADVYLALDRPEAAIDLLLPLALDGGLDPRGTLVLADLLADLDRPAEGLELVELLLEDGYVSGETLRVAGQIASQMGRLQDAEGYLRRALRLEPTNPDAILSLLVLLSQLEPRLMSAPDSVDVDLREEVAELLQRAQTNADGSSLRHSYLLGALLRRMERHDEALGHLERARELDPQNRQVLFDLAVSQEATRDFRGAAATLDTLIRLDPDDAELLNFYGYLLAEQGWELERAEEMILRALEQEPDNGAYIDSLGWVYYQQGRYEEALDKLIDASNRLGDDPIILEHLGDALMALGQPTQALRAFERALQVGGDPERLRERIEGARRASEGSR